VRFFSTLLNPKLDNLDPGMAAEIPQQPTTHALGTEPTVEHVVTAIKSMGNSKTVGPDEFPVESLNVGRHHDPTVLRESLQVTIWVWRKAGMTVLHKTKDRTECEIYRGISLLAQPGKVLLKIVAKGLGDYYQAKGLLQEEQCEFCPHRSTLGIMFAIRKLQQLGRKASVALCLCCIDV